MALSDFLNKHKVTVPGPLIEQELSLQAAQRVARVSEFNTFFASLEDLRGASSVQQALETAAGFPVPNEAARAAAAGHDVNLQAERVEQVLLRACRDRPA